LGKAFVFNGNKWEEIGTDAAGMAVDLISDVPTAYDATVIDGVTLAPGMRVLLAKQTLYKENGIYLYTIDGILDILPDALINAGTTVVAIDGVKLRGSNFVCFYIGARPWVPLTTETAWHDMQYLTTVAAIAKNPVTTAVTESLANGSIPAI
jgi:hypothetical protein